MKTLSENDARADMRDKATEHLADQYQLAAVLARIKPKKSVYFAAMDAALLYRTAKRIAALSVASCNYQLSQRQETRRENLAKKIQTIAAWYGLKASTGGDPRGFVVRLTGKGLPQNGWGEGYGVDVS